MSFKGIFCAICGAQEVEIREGFCSDCYGKEDAIAIKLPQRIKIFYCRECISVQSHMGWSRPEDFEEFIWLLKVTAQEYEKLPEDFRLEVQEEQLYKVQDTVEIISSITFPIIVQLLRNYEGDFGYYTREEEVEFRLQKTMCKTCLSRNTSAFSSSVQIRASSRSLTNEEIELIDSKVNQFFGDLPPESTSFVVERSLIENGIDFLLSQKNDAEMIIKEIKKYMGGEMKRSSSLVGQEKDGKKINRLTILLRLPEIQKGDIITFKDNLYIVIFFQQGFWRFRNLSTGETIRITERERIKEKVQSVLDRINPSKYMLVSKDGDQAQVMHLDYYTTFDIPTSHMPEGAKEGEELVGFEWEEQIYLLSNVESEKTSFLRKERELERAAKK